jgi:hypothetical protein
MLVWALLAVANLASGVAIASRVERQTDLETMRRWGREWLVGFIVLLPLAALLIFDAGAATLAVRRKLFWALQLGMMADVPGLWRRFGNLLWLPASVGALLIHFERGLVVALFACVLALAVRTLKAPSTQSNL